MEGCRECACDVRGMGWDAVEMCIYSCFLSLSFFRPGINNHYHQSIKSIHHQSSSAKHISDFIFSHHPIQPPPSTTLKMLSTSTIFTTLFLAISSVLALPTITNDLAPIPLDECTATVITTTLGTFCDFGNGDVVPILSQDVVSVPITVPINLE